MDREELFKDYLEFNENILFDIGVDLIHYKKLERQTQFIIDWITNGAIGYIEAVTGFGKTYLAIFGIFRLQSKYPNAVITVIVPSTKLYNDWCSETGYINVFGLRNINVYIVNTYTLGNSRINYTCDLLICDELHHYCSDDAQYFNTVIDKTTFKFFMGLTATLDKPQREFLKSINIKCIGTVSLKEAHENAYISDFVVYNLGLTLNLTEREKYEEISERHGKYFAKFIIDGNPLMQFNLALACRLPNNVKSKVGGVTRTGLQWREWVALTKGYKGNNSHPFSPKNIYVYASRWHKAMLERQSFLSKHRDKILAACEVIEHLNRKTITFSQNTDFVDQLTLAIPNSAAYHSNLEAFETDVKKVDYRKTLTAAKKHQFKVNGKIGIKEEKGYPIQYIKKSKVSKAAQLRDALTGFYNNRYDVLNTAKALDEGADIPDIECVILLSGTSKKRQYLQRIGRGLRFIANKKTYVINIYFQDTKDESWLESRQKGSKTPIKINSVKQIELDNVIKGANLLFDTD